MKRWLTGTKVAAACALWAAGQLAAAPEIAPLISRLADDSFQERERAARDLLEMAKSRGAEVQPALVDAMRHSPEPEVRHRSKELLMKMFTSTVGYVGVRYGPDNFIDKMGKVRLGVRIIWVEPGSPAEIAGILPMDVIVALDEVPLDLKEPDKDFATRVQLLGIGRPAVLKVYRGVDEMDFKIKLGARTVPLAPEQASALFKARIQAMEKPPSRD